MAVTQTYTIDLVNHATPVVVPVSQYDVGRVIKFNIRNNGATYDVSSYSAILQGKFSNGKSFKITGSVSGSTASFTCTKESTSFCGRVMAEVRIAKGSETVGTMNFVWEVEETPDTTHPVTQSDIAIYQQLVAQAQAAAAQAQTYANQANQANKLQKRTYVMIGDSYGAGQNMSDSSKNWINYLKGYLSNDPNYVTAYSSAISGSGFIGQSTAKTFKEQLVSIADNLSATQRGSVTDIVVLGGWNDGNCRQSAGDDVTPTERNDFATAVGAFNSRARTLFPNAKIWIGHVAWCDPSKYSGNTWNCADGQGEYAQWAGIYGWCYMANIEYTLHVYSAFTSDGLHPNEYGQRRIAKYACTALMGGSISVKNGPYMTTWKMASGVSIGSPDSPRISTTLDNDVVTFWANIRQFEFSSAITIAHGDSYIPLLYLGNDNHVRGQIPTAVSWIQPGIITCGSPAYWQDVEISFRINKNALEFQVINPITSTNTTWRTFSNVTRLYIDHEIIYSGALPSRYT